jgi:hypothetical protein
MSGSIGIMAYGSLLQDPGAEIEKATVRAMSGIANSGAWLFKLKAFGTMCKNNTVMSTPAAKQAK